MAKPANWAQLYGRRWRNLRRQFLTEHPLCVMCQKEGKVTAADELDHIERHRGDPVKFYDESNLQGLCRYHHRTIKLRMERGTKSGGCDEQGHPLEPRGHW